MASGEAAGPTHSRARQGPGGVAHLEGLHEGPQQDADGVALTQQLDEPGGTEQTQEAEIDEVVLREQGCPLTSEATSQGSSPYRRGPKEGGSGD